MVLALDQTKHGLSVYMICLSQVLSIIHLPLLIMNGPPSSSTQNKGSLKSAGESRIREYNLKPHFLFKNRGLCKGSAKDTEGKGKQAKKN
jgi:hypothetical protein